MRITVAGIIFSAVIGVSISASAQQQNNPIAFDNLSKSKNGQWAEYTMTGMPQALKMRYAVVERNDKLVGLEVDSNTPMGRVLMHMQFDKADDTWSVGRAVVMVNDIKKVVPKEQLKAGDIKKNDEQGTLVGSETVTTPVGKFEAKHYTRKAVMPDTGAEQQIDVWMSDKAMPTGLVKMSAANGLQLMLTATGGDAKSQLPFEADKTDKANKAEKVKPAKQQN